MVPWGGCSPVLARVKRFHIYEHRKTQWYTKLMTKSAKARVALSTGNFLLTFCYFLSFRWGQVKVKWDEVNRKRNVTSKVFAWCIQASCNFNFQDSLVAPAVSKIFAHPATFYFKSLHLLFSFLSLSSVTYFLLLWLFLIDLPLPLRLH